MSLPDLRPIFAPPGLFMKWYQRGFLLKIVPCDPKRKLKEILPGVFLPRGAGQPCVGEHIHIYFLPMEKCEENTCRCAGHHENEDQTRGEGDTQSFAGNTLDPTSTSPTCMPSETWSQGFTYLSPGVSIYKMIYIIRRTAWGSQTMHANLITQGLAHSRCLIMEVIIISVLGLEFPFSQILALDKACPEMGTVGNSVIQHKSLQGLAGSR